jgi:DNA-binding transcriptional LysR family regulator
VNLSAFDLNLLLVLEALLKERSATRAGKRVGLSQSAVSNALARLRAALGDPLFMRTGGAMTPTAHALALEAPLDEVLATLRRALGGPPPFDPARTPYRARFATTDYLELVVLAPLVRALRAKAPAVTLECRRLSWMYELPIAALEKGEVDLALGDFGRIPPGHGLRARRLFEDRMVVLADGPPKRLHLDAFAVRPQTKVLYGADGPGLIGEALRRLGRDRVTPVITPHFCSVAYYVKGTDVLGIVPERLARLQAPLLGLSVLRLPIDLPSQETTLVWHERNEPAAPHAFLRELVGGMGSFQPRKK